MEGPPSSEVLPLFGAITTGNRLVTVSVRMAKGIFLSLHKAWRGVSLSYGVRAELVTWCISVDVRPRVFPHHLTVSARFCRPTLHLKLEGHQCYRGSEAQAGWGQIQFCS